MMDLAEILKSESSVVALTTTGITAAVTLTVVYVAHRLTHMRARAELHAKKVEEAYLLLAQARSLGMEMIARDGARISTDLKFQEFREKMDTLGMYAYLYIPKMEDYLEQMAFAVSYPDDETFPYHSPHYEGVGRRASYLLSQSSRARDALRIKASKIA